MLILIFTLIILRLCDAKNYENYTLYRGIPLDSKHLDFFRNLSYYDVNFWREPGSLRMPVEFIISPAHKEAFLKEADEKGIYLSTLMDDIQRAFEMQTVKSYIRRQMESFDWHNYYRLSDIYQWLTDLSMSFPKEVFIESIGKTYEDNDILAVNVILKGSLRRSKVIIEGGIHAREWISPAFVTYMIHQIVLSSISADPSLRKIALTYEWYFVPVVNPDGYEYTQNEDRLWRKNRHNSGVDLNRNFGYGFGTVGISFMKQSDVYCGDRAFSEQETAAMARFIRSKSMNLEYYLSFHSYGQYIIIPYAHSKKHVENYAEMKEMGMRAANKIKLKHNTRYNVGTAYDTVGYLVGGSSTCWVKRNLSVPYVLTFELRDTGSYGFALPASQILPTCEETLAGVMSLLTPKNKELISNELLLHGSGNSFVCNIVLYVLLFITVIFA